MASERFDEIPLASLCFDPENPRLSRGVEWAAAPSIRILEELFRRYNLKELGQSIADKGFSPRHAEALLVIEDERTEGKYVVIEGNRRLATLQLLDSASLRRAMKAGSEWDELSESASHIDYGSVPVIIYPGREELDGYLGFRHITGPKQWRPEAKARFIARLLAGGDSVSEVVRRIGSNHRTVRRYAEAHAVFEQASESGFAVDVVESAYGVFYNALAEDGVRGFLGLNPQANIDSLPENPVSEGRLARLEELIEFIYGDDSKGLERVIRESRELSKLSAVLKDDTALTNLRRDRNLDQAWRDTGGGKVEVLALIGSAFTRFAEAYGKALAFPGDEDIEREIKKIHNLAKEAGSHFGFEDRTDA